MYKDEQGMINTCWSLSGLYVKVHIQILVHFLVLTIKLFIKARIQTLLRILQYNFFPLEIVLG